MATESVCPDSSPALAVVGNHIHRDRRVLGGVDVRRPATLVASLTASR